MSRMRSCVAILQPWQRRARLFGVTNVRCSEGMVDNELSALAGVKV